MDNITWAEYQNGFVGNDHTLMIAFALGFLAILVVGILVSILVSLNLRCADSVTVVSGFYQGCSGYVLDKRLLVFYDINMTKGPKVTIPRWHLRHRRTPIHEKIRNMRLENRDRYL